MSGPTDPTEPIPSSTTEPLPPAGAPGPPPLLRRAWLAWGVAGVVLGAGLGVSIWMTGERADLREELAGTARELRETQRRITQLSRSLERAVSRSTGLSRGIDTCVGALDDQVDLFNSLAQELNAVRTLERSQAESFHRRAERLRRVANRSLERCRGGAGP